LIVIGKEQVDLKFGTGDIGFNSGSYIKDGKTIGLVGFYNQKAREIGDEGDIKVGQECSRNDFPILMTFSKKESIDVVIQSLLDAKEQMD